MKINHLSSRQGQALRLLNDFGLEEWCRWIRQLIDGGQCKPDLEVGRTLPNRVLCWLFETGLSQTATFVEALGRVYEGTSPERVESLYYLLHAIAVIKPEYCRDLLLRHLRQRRFDSAEYGNISLKSLALSTRSAYAIDDDLLFFVRRSAIETDSFNHRLVCFRTVAKADQVGAFRLLRLLLPYLHNARDQKILGGVLRGIAWVETYQGLYRWFISPYRERLERENPEMFHHFKTALRNWVAPWRPSVLRSIPSDPYAVLLAATLAAGDWPFVAEELLLIAKAAEHPLLELSEEVERTLRTVWDATTNIDRDWIKPGSYPGLLQANFAWIGPDQEGILHTDWRDELLAQQENRELFGQTVKVATNDRIFEILAKGTRVLPSRRGQQPRDILSQLDLEGLLFSSLQSADDDRTH